jgi:hypothetical protein
VRAGIGELVFAYPSELAGLNNRYTAMLTPRELESERKLISFEKAAEDFAAVYSGKEPKKPPKYIHIFSLQRADKSSKRSKVVCDRSVTPTDYIKAAEEWRKGCANIPEMHRVEARTPFPLKAAGIVNAVWRQDGRSSQVERMKYYQGIELLIDSAKPPLLDYYIQLIVQNAFGLVVFAGNTQQLSQFHTEKIADLTAMLGLLLYKRDIRKEAYMTQTAFLMGRALKLCDDLHMLYCQVERKGDVPPQLAGASMFATAADSPDRALALICQRMIPYLTWARTYQQYGQLDEKHLVIQRTALRRLKQFEELSGQLSQALDTPARFGDFEKAQLFLGYLAALPQNAERLRGETNDEQ